LPIILNTIPISKNACAIQVIVVSPVYIMRLA
jgi:hypothetical protein